MDKDSMDIQEGTSLDLIPEGKNVEASDTLEDFENAHIQTEEGHKIGKEQASKGDTEERQREVARSSQSEKGVNPSQNWNEEAEAGHQLKRVWKSGDMKETGRGQGERGENPSKHSHGSSGAMVGAEERAVDGDAKPGEDEDYGRRDALGCKGPQTRAGKGSKVGSNVGRSGEESEGERLPLTRLPRSPSTGGGGTLGNGSRQVPGGGV